MVSVSRRDPDFYTQMVLGVVRRDRATKMGFKDWFGHALELECRAEFPVNEKQEVSNL